MQDRLSHAGDTVAVLHEHPPCTSEQDVLTSTTQIPSWMLTTGCIVTSHEHYATDKSPNQEGTHHNLDLIPHHNTLVCSMAGKSCLCIRHPKYAAASCHYSFENIAVYAISDKVDAKL